MEDTSIIIWDDSPSSPFITEIGDTSRKSSRVIQNVHAVEPQDDLLHVFEQTPVAQKRIFSRASPNGNKENCRPMSLGASLFLETPLATPSKSEPATTPQQTTGRRSVLPSSTSSQKTCYPLAEIDVTPSRSKPTIPESPSKPMLNDTTREQADKRDGTTSQQALISVDDTNVDDTCFSTFSAVPEMTLFANLRPNSPAKTIPDDTTPRTSRKRLSTSRSPSPNPRRPRATTNQSTDSTTSLLIDFTQQFDAFAAASADTARGRPSSPSRPIGLSPSRTESQLSAYLSAQRTPMAAASTRSRPAAGRQSMSPSKSHANLLSLLDFELPPPPTPKSAPQFSARDMEALKADLTTQLSSVRARLSGKEAELESLRKALDDAERRAGRAEEAARAERGRREAAEADKDGWERRGAEVERVLASVRDEVVRNEAEREALEARCDEAERRAEGADARNMELTTRLAATATATSGEPAAVDEAAVAELVQAQLDAKIEAVSRELHAVYKRKHETKVATLKKSYEARGDRRVAELQGQVAALSAELETRDGPAPSSAGEDATAELRAELEGALRDNARLAAELEVERGEKGELVAAVDEMLSLQAGTAQGDVSVVIEDFRKSLSRPPPLSGLRQPVQSVHAAAAAPGDAQVKAPAGRSSGLVRPGLGKSKMMSNIERMGSAGGQRE